MKKIGTAFAICLGLATEMGCTLDADPHAPAAPAQVPGTTPPSTPPTGTVIDPLSLPPKPEPGNAMVRAVHASADAPAVDIYAKGNDKPLVTNLNYGQTSGWLELPQGTYDIELRAAPSKPTDPIVYKTGPLAFGDQQLVSAVAVGLASSANADASLRLLPVIESFDDAAPGGKIKIRALHAGADAPTVGVDIGNDNPTAPEVATLPRFSDTGKEGVMLPSNQALAIGIDKGGSRVTAFTTPKLPDGAQVLVIATGLLGKLARERDGFALLAIGPNGSVGFIKQDPIVYALHAAPDAPAVDAFVGATEIVDNLEFGQISKPIQVKPGEYQLDFYATTPGAARPDAKPAAVGNTGQLAAGERYLAEAAGFLGTKFQLIGYREGFDVNSGKAILRAVHASPDAPAVDIGAVANGTIAAVLFKDLTFSKASDEKGVGADEGHVVVGVSPTGSTSPVATFTVPAANGQRAFTIAAGALAPKPGNKSFRLLLVDTAKSPWTATTLFPH